TGKKGAIVVANKMKEKIEVLNISHEKSPINNSITASFGIAFGIPQNHLGTRDLYHKADIALYKSKSKGRNRITTLRAF
ncbi:MAG: diguanylate cyclase, partial [Spirochaetes bacterium]|nr:diguanylate cyclase [Spirochaetota bacterium]